MANLRRFRSPRTSSGVRRATAWSSGPRQIPVGLTAAGAQLWAVGSQSTLSGLTLIRVRGEFTAVLDVVTAIGDGFERIAVGMCIVSENAFDAGVTAVPSPITDIGWDGWLYHRLLGQFRGSSTTELGRSPMEAVRIEMDSKAMRKFKQTDVLIGVVELAPETGAATLTFSATTRLLTKLA